MSVGQRDEHSGYMTTGHEWNGITELNTPVPFVVVFFLVLTFMVSCVMWLLLPSWPVGTSYTPGLLGLNERQVLQRELVESQKRQAVWTGQIVTASFDGTGEAGESVGLSKDTVAYVRSAGKQLFADNCGPCHGGDAAGGPGYPNLVDGAWLWGRGGDEIMETLRVGINSSHEDSRSSQMPSFGLDETLDRDAVGKVVSYVFSLNEDKAFAAQAGDGVDAGVEIFEENCAACHGEDAKGSVEFGAPNLTDAFWIYGGDREAVFKSIWNGRQGHMPHWDMRLSDVQRKVLTLYLLDLGNGK